MRILVASGNAHKLDEIRAVFTECARQSSADGPAAGPGCAIPQLIGLRDLGVPIAEPPEDQPTFEGNALLKARYYGQATGLATLADDSGLEVDALGGEPGVRSARYAGVRGARAEVDHANNRLLLEKLRDAPPERRTARFVCVMVLLAAAPNAPAAPAAVQVTRGSVEGRILRPPEAADAAQPWRGRGDNGFGYDPLFLIPSLGRTVAELPPTQKNALSHRGQAARQMWAAIRRLLQSAPP